MYRVTTDRDFASTFYPFLRGGGSAQPSSDPNLLESVRLSTLAKCAELMALRRELFAEHDADITRAAMAMADRFTAGGTLFAFGNGGSATDADDAVADCLRPPRTTWRALPAIALSAESATVTALANDVGLEQVFARQVGALAGPTDIALGFSTSGNSANVVAGLAEARRRGLLTIALSGYDGGAMASGGNVDVCFVARREYVPRIQEGHATLWHALLAVVQESLLLAGARAA